MTERRNRIPGAPIIRMKGRGISGHPTPLEVRTWQESQRAEELDHVVRSNGRLEPRDRPPPQDPPRGVRHGFRRT